MDPLSFKSLLFLLAFTGCCVGQVVPSVDAILGGNVTLKNPIAMSSYAFVTWTFSDRVNKPASVVTVSPTYVKVNQSYQGRVSANQSSGDLTLAQLKPEDSGDYTVSIISATGDTKTDEIKLFVLNPVSNVVITSNVVEAIEFNSTVVLNCTGQGSILKFTWTTGNSTIVPDGSRISLQKGRTYNALTITGILRTDLAGPVYCTASNKLQTSQSAPFSLPVYYGPDPVSVSPQLFRPFIRSDSNFSLSCSAVSSPPAAFTWFHSQQKIDVVGPVLTLQALRDKGLGRQLENYTCIATNAKTLRAVASPAVAFVVLDPISGTTIIGPTTTLIAGNSSANLSCKATGGTVQFTTWEKHDKQLTPSSRLVFSNDTSSLMISPVQKEDNGVYKCRIRNHVSSAEAFYKMVVNFGPDQPTVTGISKVEENHPVTLTCSAMSLPPANFTWKYNGTLTPVKTHKYTMEKPVLTNSGIYTCEAYNPVTGITATSSFTMQVKAEGTMDHGLSDGAIAGIVVAILIAVAAAIAVTIYCRQKVPIESPY